MQTITVSATAARNNFFELLNKVALGSNVIIERDHKEVAIISPKITKTDWKGLVKASKKVSGILKDDDMNDNPLRREGASNFLGEWDKKFKRT